MAFARMNDAAAAWQLALRGYKVSLYEREERLVHAFALRYLFRFEAEHLLARAGFAVEHLYGGYDRSPYGSTYPGELIFIAGPGRLP